VTSDAFMPARRAGASEDGEPRGLPAPYGTDLPRMSAMHLFGELPGALGLRPIDVMTPWAIRTSDGHWQVEEHPSANYEFHALSAKDLKRGKAELFGHEVPFVAVVTHKLPSQAQAAAAFMGSPFVFYETQAVYSQFDKSEPPRVWFVSWGERRDAIRGPMKSIDAVAAQLGGRSVYGLQIPREGSTERRRAPAMPFALALEGQVERERPTPRAGSAGLGQPIEEWDPEWKEAEASAAGSRTKLALVGGAILAGIVGFIALSERMK